MHKIICWVMRPRDRLTQVLMPVARGRPITSHLISSASAWVVGGRELVCTEAGEWIASRWKCHLIRFWTVWEPGPRGCSGMDTARLPAWTPPSPGVPAPYTPRGPAPALGKGMVTFFSHGGLVSLEQNRAVSFHSWWHLMPCLKQAWLFICPHGD